MRKSTMFTTNVGLSMSYNNMPQIRHRNPH